MMTWQHKALLLTALWMIFSGIGACAGPQPQQPSASPDEAGVIGRILGAPARFESGTVTIAGEFQGWRGPCRSGPPVSRSDWMITDATGCLYVHGPLPPGLDPSKPGGENVTVTGVVRIKRNTPYLDLGPAGLPPR